MKQNAKREKALVDKLKNTKCPEIVLRPPATIIDVLDFMYQVSMDYDYQEGLGKRRGVNFAVKSPHLLVARIEPEDSVPRMCDLGRPWCTLYDALTNVCERTDEGFTVRDNTVVIYPAAETNTPPAGGR